MRALTEITKRVIEHYRPDSIILFGSRASRVRNKSSDIDLLVIKSTDKRPLERRMDVERILSDRSVPLDIFVYTPDEVCRLYAAGSPFIEEIMERGRLIYVRKATEAWVNEATEELEAARLLFDHRKYRAALYHSQQCIEKGLKALVIEKGKKPEKTLDVIELLNRSRRLGYSVPLSMDDAVYINSVYKGRYPTEEGLLPHGDPVKEEVDKAITCAEKLTAHLSEMLGSSPS
jgi:HEPN domain-containing protein/predicted nucleotidyltransferase